MEETIPNNPMEPDSDRILDESELVLIVKSIADSLLALKGKYHHFDNYDPKRVISSPTLIWYRNNLGSEPNPEYTKELKPQANAPPIKRPLPPKERAVYPELDGLELFIKFTDYDTFKSSQNIWLPKFWLCNYAVKLKVNGAKTLEIEEIKKRFIRC